MNINYLQIAIGIIIGIALCIQFPNFPNQLKQMAKNFKENKEKQQAENKTADEIKKEDKPKVIILDDNELSIMKYAEEFPENWKKICDKLDEEKKNE